LLYPAVKVIHVENHCFSRLHASMFAVTTQTQGGKKDF